MVLKCHPTLNIGNDRSNYTKHSQTQTESERETEGETTTEAETETANVCDGELRQIENMKEEGQGQAQREGQENSFGKS